MKKLTFLFAFAILLTAAAFASNEITGIRINGNKTTKAFVIENFLGYRPGMKADLNKLFEAQNIMMNSGLFSGVYMNFEDATDGNYTLVVDVNENSHIAPTLDLVKGAGLSDTNLFGLGLKGSLSVRFFNLSPFEVFYGGYSASLSALRAFGTPFSFSVNRSDLQRMQWYSPSGWFYYDMSEFDVGIGSMTSQNTGFMAGYIHEEAAPETSSIDFASAASSAGSIDAFYASLSKYADRIQDSRAYWWGNLNVEHGLNQLKYDVFTADYNFYYRIIARIYAKTRLYGIVNHGDVPFMRKAYLGNTYNLKGYPTNAFGDPYMALAEVRLGVPLTSSFGISKSPEMTSYTVELIPQLAFATAGNDLSLSDFKPSIGLGLKLNTPFGTYEPEIFFGSQFGFYLEF